MTRRIAWFGDMETLVRQPELLPRLWRGQLVEFRATREAYLLYP